MKITFNPATRRVVVETQKVIYYIEWAACNVARLMWMVAYDLQTGIQIPAEEWELEESSAKKFAQHLSQGGYHMIPKKKGGFYRKKNHQFHIDEALKEVKAAREIYPFVVFISER